MIRRRASRQGSAPRAVHQAVGGTKGSAPPRGLGAALVGRSFISPAVDYLLIGGGLSLVVTVIVLLHPARGELVDPTTLPYFILLANSAHFAASTLRLYTKPGACQSLPFLSLAFPLVMVALLTASLFWADELGPPLTALYLTWSPFHYAAQAYGLAVVYGYRSGCALEAADKRWLWRVSMLPFLYSFLLGGSSGLGYLAPASWLEQQFVLDTLRSLSYALPVAAALGVAWLLVKVWRSNSGPLPLISWLAIVTNGVWWFVLPPANAFVWATIFHGVQYLAIVAVFHVQDQRSQPENRHGALWHAVWFYARAVLLGYLLFSCLPWAYVFAGFGMTESMLLVTAAINIHHFIVDAYIWRLKKGDGNRRIVEGGSPGAVPAG